MDYYSIQKHSKSLHNTETRDGRRFFLAQLRLGQTLPLPYHIGMEFTNSARITTAFVSRFVPIVIPFFTNRISLVRTEQTSFSSFLQNIFHTELPH